MQPPQGDVPNDAGAEGRLEDPFGVGAGKGDETNSVFSSANGHLNPAEAPDEQRDDSVFASAPGDGSSGGAAYDDWNFYPDDFLSSLTHAARAAIEKVTDDAIFSIIGEDEPRTHTPTPPDIGGDGAFVPADLGDRVAIMLLYHEAVHPELIHRTWSEWSRKQRTGKADTFWRYLAQQPEVDKDRVFETAADVYAFPKADISRDEVVRFVKRSGSAFTTENWTRLRRLCLVPIEHRTGAGVARPRWVFATHDPSHPDVFRLLEELGIYPYELCYAPQPLLVSILDHAQLRRNKFLDELKDHAGEDLGIGVEDEKGLVDDAALDAQIKRSALINLFEAMLVEAVRSGASDIHVYPNARKEIEIHFRINGELVRWWQEDRVHPEAFLAVVKDNARNVDRFERDTAQDGYIQRTVDDALMRYRVSVLPIANATPGVRSESIVIRVLDDRKAVGKLSSIIVSEHDRERFEWALQQPQGMVILTGPTGSGKTTTLLSSIQEITTPKVNVVTLEDPIEYLIPGVRQVKVGHRLSLDHALRYILRHDPDVVMVGEMRDRETAKLAVQLANTGHLTLTTLHTNDAPSAVSRLFKMGIEPFLVAYAINLVAAQRLLRTLCPRCKRIDRNPNRVLLHRIGLAEKEMEGLTVFVPGEDARCETCRGVGYAGRRAITETMVFTPAVRQLIVTAKRMVNEDKLRAQAVADGMHTLRSSAIEMIRQGDTSVLEVLRTIPTEYRPPKSAAV